MTIWLSVGHGVCSGAVLNTRTDLDGLISGRQYYRRPNLETAFGLICRNLTQPVWLIRSNCCGDHGPGSVRLRQVQNGR